MCLQWLAWCRLLVPKTAKTFSPLIHSNWIIFSLFRSRSINILISMCQALQCSSFKMNLGPCIQESYEVWPLISWFSLSGTQRACLMCIMQLHRVYCWIHFCKHLGLKHSWDWILIIWCICRFCLFHPILQGEKVQYPCFVWIHNHGHEHHGVF